MTNRRLSMKVELSFEKTTTPTIDALSVAVYSFEETRIPFTGSEENGKVILDCGEEVPTYAQYDKIRHKFPGVKLREIVV